MKNLLILILFLLSVSQLQSSVPDTTRAELFRLLSTRKELFEKYSSSLDKKSGLFGNRTKNDMRFSHEMLRDIVEADNDIIDALNRAMSYRNFEKLNYSFDANKSEDRIASLKVLNDTLNSQVDRLTLLNKNYKGSLKRTRFMNVVLFLFLISLIAYKGYKKYWRKRERT